MVEQLSLFAVDRHGNITATCCWDGAVYSALEPEQWMIRLVPTCEFYIMQGKHIATLSLTPLSEAEIPQGHQYRHYRIMGTIYDAVYVQKYPEEG